MAEPSSHISALADTLRRKGPEGISLSHTLVQWTKECWRHESSRADAEVIMNAFPREFT